MMIRFSVFVPALRPYPYVFARSLRALVEAAACRISSPLAALRALVRQNAGPERSEIALLISFNNNLQALIAP